MPLEAPNGYVMLKFSRIRLVSAVAILVSTVLVAPAHAASYTPPGMRELPDPLYGVTLDDVSGSSTNRIAAEMAAIKSLPRRAITRVVFDEDTGPGEYTRQVAQMHPDTYILGELSDSLYMRQLSVTQYIDRARSFVSSPLGNTVDLWELGNEVNGNWTGSYSSVSQKISGAYGVVKAAGKRTELTLWYNPGCAGSRSELDPVTFSGRYVPTAVRAGLDYVLISYYETECNNYRPSAATLTNVFTQLHSLYPNARLGFGEIGLPDPARSSTRAKAQSIAAYYYGLKINLSYYVGGYFYWYFAQDAVPSTKPIWKSIATAMSTY